MANINLQGGGGQPMSSNIWPSVAGLSAVTQIEQRTVLFSVRLVCTNPTNHIIAIITSKNDLLIYNATSWSQILRKCIDSDGSNATCLTWRFDSRLVAIGYRSGKIGLTDVEDEKEVYALLPLTNASGSGAVALLNWLPSCGWTKQGEREPRNHLNPYVLRLHQLHNSALPMPQQSSSGAASALLTEKAKQEYLNSELKLFNQTRMSFLAAWYSPSHVVLYAYGLYAVMDLDFHSSSLRWTLRTADCLSNVRDDSVHIRMPLAVAMSADHRDLMFSFIVGGNADTESKAADEDVIQNTSFDTSILYYGFYELEAVMFRMCKIDAYLDFVDKTLAKLEESCSFVSDDGLEHKLRTYLRTRQLKLNGFQSTYDRPMGDNALQVLFSDLVELLTMGMMDEELELLVRHALTPDAVRRLATNLDRSYTKLRDLCFVHLQPALEAIVLLFDELRVFSSMSDKFGIIFGSGKLNSSGVVGQQDSICAGLLETSASLLLKSRELICVIEQCVNNMRAFFEWLFIDLDLLVEMPDSEVGHAWGFRGGSRQPPQRANNAQMSNSSPGGQNSSSQPAAHYGSNMVRGGNSSQHFMGNHHPMFNTHHHQVYAQENEGRTGGATGVGFMGAYAMGNSGAVPAAGGHHAMPSTTTGSGSTSPSEEVRMQRLAANVSLSTGVGLGGAHDTITCVLEFIRDTFAQHVLLNDNECSGSADGMQTSPTSTFNHSTGQHLRLDRIAQYLRDAPLDKCYPFSASSVAVDARRKPHEHDLYTPGGWSTTGLPVGIEEPYDDINEFSRRFVDFGDDEPKNDASLGESDGDAAASRRRRPLKHTLFRVERTKSLKQLFNQLRRHTKDVLLPTILRQVSARVAVNGAFPLMKLSDADCASSSNTTSLTPACVLPVPRLQLSCYERFLQHSHQAVDDSAAVSCNKFITAIQVSPRYVDQMRQAGKSGDDESHGTLLVVRHEIKHSKSSTLNILRDAHFIMENNNAFMIGNDAAHLDLSSLLPAPSTNKVAHHIALININILPLLHDAPLQKDMQEKVGEWPVRLAVQHEAHLRNFTYLHLTDQLMLLIQCADKINQLKESVRGHAASTKHDAAYLFYISLPQLFQSDRKKIKISNDCYPSTALLDWTVAADAVSDADIVDGNKMHDDGIRPRRLRFAAIDANDGAEVQHPEKLLSAVEKCFITIPLRFPAANDVIRQGASSVQTNKTSQINCIPGVDWDALHVVCMQKLAILFQKSAPVVGSSNTSRETGSGAGESQRIAFVCLQPSIRARRAAERSLHNPATANSATGLFASSSTTTAGQSSDLYCCEREAASSNAIGGSETYPLPVCNSHAEMLSATCQSLFVDLCLPQRYEYDESLACRARRFASRTMHKDKSSTSRTDAGPGDDPDKFGQFMDVEMEDADDEMIASMFAQLDSAPVGRVQQPDDPRWLTDEYVAAADVPEYKNAPTSDNISERRLPSQNTEAEGPDDSSESWAAFIQRDAVYTRKTDANATTDSGESLACGTAAAAARELRFQQARARRPNDGLLPFHELALSSSFINTTINKRTSTLLGAPGSVLLTRDNSSSRETKILPNKRDSRAHQI